MALYQNGKYKQAAKRFAKADALDKAEMDSTGVSHTPRRLYAAWWQANCYYLMGDTAKAQATFADDYMTTPIDRRLTVTSDSLSNLASDYYQQEDYRRAYDTMSRCLELEQAFVPPGHPYLANDYMFLGYCQEELGDTAAALAYYKQAADIRVAHYGVGAKTSYYALFHAATTMYGRMLYAPTPIHPNGRMRYAPTSESIKYLTMLVESTGIIYGKESENYYAPLNMLATCYAYTDQDDKTAELKTEVMRLAKKLEGPESFYYIFNLPTMANYNRQKGNYAIAAELYLDLLPHLEKTVGKEHADYGTAMMNLATCYREMGQYAEAIKWDVPVVEFVEKAIGKDNEAYLSRMSDLVSDYASRYDYSNAIERQTEAAEIARKLYGERSVEYANKMHMIALYHYNLGDYKQAIELNRQIMQLREELIGKENIYYAASLNNLGIALNQTGNPNEAITLLEQALHTLEQTTGKHTADYALYLTNLAVAKDSIGDRSSALPLLEEARNVYAEVFGVGSREALQATEKIIDQYELMGQLQRADSLLRILLPGVAQLYGEKSYAYAMLLRRHTKVFKGMRLYEGAVRAGNYACAIIEQLYGKEHQVYADVACEVADCYRQQRKYQEALRYEEEAAVAYAKRSGEQNALYGKAISRIAQLQNYLNKPQEAVKYGNEALRVLRYHYNDSTIVISDLLHELAWYNHRANNDTTALRLGQQAMRLRQELYGFRNINYINSAHNVAIYFYALRNYPQAALGGELVLQLRREIGKTDDRPYAQSLYNQGDYLLRMKLYAEAADSYIQALTLRRRIMPKDTLTLALTMHSAGHALYYANNKDSSFVYMQQATDLRRQKLGRSHPEFLKSLAYLTTIINDLGRHREGIPLVHELVEGRLKTLGESHADYASAIHRLGSFYYHADSITQAHHYMQQAVDLKRQWQGTENESYLNSLSYLATITNRLYDYAHAAELQQQVVDGRSRVKGTDNITYAQDLHDLADYLSSLGRYEEAAQHERQAADIRKKVQGDSHPAYATCIGTLCNYHEQMGDYETALRLSDEEMAIRERTAGKNSSVYANALNRRATICSTLGFNDEALSLSRLVVELRRTLFGDSTLSYATALNNLAVKYSNIGKNDTAAVLYQQAIDIESRILGKNNPTLATVYGNLAAEYAVLKRYNEAIALSKTSLKMREAYLGRQHPGYGMSLNNLGNIYSNAGKKRKAIRLTKKALKVWRQSLGDSHPNINTGISNLAFCYFDLGLYNKAEEYEQQDISRRTQSTLQAFQYMNTTDRAAFWDNQSYSFEYFLPRLCHYAHTDNCAAMTYDGVLLSKGLLLNADIEMQKLLLESGDTAAIEMFTSLQALRTQLSAIYEKPLNERPSETDSLEKTATQLETQLIQTSKQFGDYTANLRINWQQVREKLGANEAAVEFLRYSLKDHTPYYGALVLRRGYKAPHFVPLCTERSIRAVKANAYNTDSLSLLLWKPLAKELQGATDIYFAPAGELYKIGIEYLPTIGTDPMAAQTVNYYRLSSTRELAKRLSTGSGQAFQQAVLYGGIKYSLDESEKQTASTSHSTFRDVPLLRDIRGARKTIPYLPGSKQEVDDIASIMEQHHIPASILPGAQGTEESFKQLSGQGISVIHISTHGFYEQANTVIGKSSKAARAQTDTASVTRGASKEDRSLSRSGLFLAGAADFLYGKAVADNGLEDGILTAREISRLDLRGLRLVVLSACETGLGDVSGEGVFGLQRGFKKAGAQTLLMSLWKVDDHATQLLMTEFYRHLTTGSTKRNAFLAAQQYLRTAEGGRYSRPEFWAAFIMLDGIE